MRSVSAAALEWVSPVHLPFSPLLPPMHALPAIPSITLTPHLFYYIGPTPTISLFLHAILEWAPPRPSVPSPTLHKPLTPTRLRDTLVNHLADHLLSPATLPSCQTFQPTVPQRTNCQFTTFFSFTLVCHPRTYRNLPFMRVLQPQGRTACIPHEWVNTKIAHTTLRKRSKETLNSIYWTNDSNATAANNDNTPAALAISTDVCIK
ncbi:hypothetical protein TcWFU_005745 [Taenia crassiceps]|uniref:Uncharacterized protein n=1 Tax=Taenia crassiceps TaxID=6207 RepID=A0ABR4Q2W0_9CEST